MKTITNTLQKLITLLIIVTLVILSSCTKQPEACLGINSYSPEKIYAGNEVQFINCSKDENSSVWDFGDGNASREHKPTHIYTEAGEYTVALTVFSKGDLKNHTNTIVVSVDTMPKQPTACFYASSDTVILGAGIEFDNCSQAEYRSVWNFGDDNVSYERSPSHTFTSVGSYKVTLIVFSVDDLLKDTITTLVNILHPTLITQGLVAYYPFTGAAWDVSGNANHGYVYGSSLANDRFGIFNRAYDFDGANDYIKANNINGYLGSSWTVHAWVFPNTVTGNNPIICMEGYYGSGKKNFYLKYGHVDQNGQFSIEFDRASNQDNFRVSSGYFPPNKWHHVVGVYNGSALLLYVNGILVNSEIVGHVSPQTSSARLHIGTETSISQYFDGVIDEVRIYDRALSAAEVKVLYEQ
ncbi:MAG: PKD domain-containing protein [Bacteroidetes bacterium]|nr:PKD domain-containing protein [Bacteroidota bacterium]